MRSSPPRRFRAVALAAVLCACATSPPGAPDIGGPDTVAPDALSAAADRPVCDLDSAAVRQNLAAEDLSATERSLALAGLSGELLGLDRLDEAEAVAREAIAVAQRAGPDGIGAEILSRGVLAEILLEQARYAEAELILGNALEILANVSEPGLRVAGHDLAGELALAKGSFVEAEAEFQTAHQIAVEAYGAESVESAVASRGLTRLALERGDYDEADRLLGRSLPVIEAQLAPEDPELAPWVLLGALVDQTLGRYADAERRYTRVLELTAASCTPRGLTHAAAAGQLAGFELLRGRLDEAEAMARDAMDIYTAKLGPDNPIVGKVASLAGRAAVLQGRLDAARSHLERAAAILSQNPGTEHLEYATVEESLGLLALAEDRLPDARAHFERAIAIREAVIGPDNPGLVFPLSKLGDTYRGGGDLDRAAAIYERVLAIADGVLYRDHPELRPVVMALASTYLDQNRLGDAETLARSIVDARIARVGADDPSVADAWADLALLYDIWQWYPQAIDAYSHALAITDAMEAPNRELVIYWRYRVGWLLNAAQRTDEAIAVLESALQEARDEGLPQDATVANLHGTLGGAYTMTGDLDAAQRHLTEALRIVRSVYGERSNEVAEVMLNLGNLEKQRGNLREAKMIYRESRDISREVLGPDAMVVAAANLNLGLIYEMEGSHSAAAHSFARAVEAYEKQVGLDHVMVGKALLGHGTALVALGRADAAAAKLERALAIAEAYPGADLTPYLDALGDALMHQGKVAEANALFARSAAANPHISETRRTGQVALLSARQAVAEGRDADAIRHYREVLAVSDTRIVSLGDRITVLSELGPALERTNDFDAAAKTYEQLLALTPPTVPATAVLASTHLLAGVWSVKAGRPKEGKAHLEHAAAIAAEAGAADVEIDARANLAWANLRTHDVPDAARAIAAAEALVGAHPDVKPALRVSVLGNKADVLRVQGKRREAAQTTARAVALYDRAGVDEPERLASMLQTWGALETIGGSPAKAEKLLQRGYDVRREFLGRDDAECGELLRLRAVALTALDRIEEATSLYENAIRVFKMQGRSENGRQSLALQGLGILYARSGRHEPALERFESAQALIRPSGATAEQYGWLMSSLGVTYFKLDRLEPSEEALAQALELVEPRVDASDPRLPQLRQNLKAVRQARKRRGI